MNKTKAYERILYITIIINIILTVTIILIPVLLLRTGGIINAEVSVEGLSIKIGTTSTGSKEVGILIGLLAGTLAGSQLVLLNLNRRGRTFDALLASSTGLLSIIIIIRNSIKIIENINKTVNFLISKIYLVNYQKLNIEVHIILYIILILIIYQFLYESWFYLSKTGHESTSLTSIVSSTSLAIALLASIIAPRIVVFIPASPSFPEVSVSADILSRGEMRVKAPLNGTIERVIIYVKYANNYLILINKSINKNYVELDVKYIRDIIKKLNISFIYVTTYIKFDNTVIIYNKTIHIERNIESNFKTNIILVYNKTGLYISVDNSNLCRYILGFEVYWISYDVSEFSPAQAGCDVAFSGPGGPVRFYVFYRASDGSVRNVSVVLSDYGRAELPVSLGGG